MPGSDIHRQITENAVILASELKGDNTLLINDYSSYPDFYFDNPKAFSKYNCFKDGIQFHYIPDTPYNELYRYWDESEDGISYRVKPFVNENFIHAHHGFKFFIENTVKNLKNGELQEGKKYLGSLLHMLEDATFSLHSLEGAHGADAFYINRLIDYPILPTEILAFMFTKGYFLADYTPRIFAESENELLMRLYAEYCRASSVARKNSFKYIMNYIEGRHEENKDVERTAYENSVKLSADLIATICHISFDALKGANDIYLSELEPHEFPFGGFGGYRFRSFERDCVYSSDGKKLPIKLVKEGEEHKYSHGISFGSHREGSLIYWIAPNIYREFSCDVGFYPDFNGTSDGVLEVINNGKSVFEVALKKGGEATEIKIENPSGNLGFKMKSVNKSGVIIVANGIFSR